MGCSDKVKVSIIVPVYNAEKTINRCLDSLIKQTENDIEIIVINDGSKDLSGSICKKYVEIDSRVVYIEQENAGVSAARNRGIDIANGEYITFSDSDDYYEIGAIKQLYDAAKKNKADWVIGAVRKKIHGVCVVVGMGNLVCDTANSRRQVIVKMTKNFMLYQLWGKLYRTEIVKAQSLLMRTEMSCGEDFEWVCRFAGYAKCIIGIEDIVYNYVINDNESLSKRFVENHYLNIETSYRAAMELYRKLDVNAQGIGFLKNRQATRIWNTVNSIAKKSCKLNIKEKVEFIKKCLQLDSYKECVIDGDKNDKKTLLLKINNTYLITAIILISKKVFHRKGEIE